MFQNKTIESRRNYFKSD